MRSLALLPLLVCLAAPAEETLFQFRLPDGAAMMAKSKQGIWKQMLDLPSLQALQAFSLRQAGIETEADASVWDNSPIPTTLDAAVLHAAPGATPRIVVRAEYGDQADAAEALWSELIAQLSTQGAHVPGALRRDGTRLDFDDGAPVAWPAALATGDADAVAVLHTDAMARAFGLIGQRVQRAFALGAWRGEFRITPKAYRETMELTARWPTFAPIDVAQLRGLPRAALFGGAIGLDGFALEEWALAVAGDLPELTLGLATLDDRCAEQGLPPFTDALFGATGTAWLAILPGAPFPTVTLALPGGTGVDTFIDALGTQAMVDLAPARDAAVMLPMPPGFPIPVMLRRSASHWILSTDMLAIEDFAAGAGAAFDDTGIAALAAGASPVGLVWSDNRLTFQQLAGFMGMAQAALQNAPPDQKEQFALTVTMMREMGALLPPSLGVITVDATTLRVRGENLIFNMGLWGGVGAGLTIPAILSVRAKADETRSANQMRQLLTAMVAWSIDHDGEFPPTLAALAADQGLIEAMLRSPLANADEALPHYLYVRPHGEVASWQPVLLENPARNPAGMLLVCQADGSIRKFRGGAAQAVWAEALRLAALPKAAADGISTEDWAAVQDHR